MPGGAAQDQESLAFQVLHDEEVDPLVRVELVEGTDVRVVQRGDRLRLTLETLATFGVGGQLGGQHFDRHRAQAVENDPLAVRFAHEPSFSAAERSFWANELSFSANERASCVMDGGHRLSRGSGPPTIQGR